MRRKTKADCVLLSNMTWYVIEGPVGLFTLHSEKPTWDEDEQRWDIQLYAKSLSMHGFKLKKLLGIDFELKEGEIAILNIKADVSAFDKEGKLKSLR